MTQNDAVKVLNAIDVSFPGKLKLNTAQDIKKTSAVWAMMLSEVEYNDVMNAVKAFILTEDKGFPPTIGQVNAILSKQRAGKGHELGEVEAWSIVRKAISHALYDSKKYFDRFPKVIKDAVGNPDILKDWAQMDTNTVDSVVSSNFMRTYRAKLKNAEFEAKLPESFLKSLGKSGEELCLLMQ